MSDDQLSLGFFLLALGLSDKVKWTDFHWALHHGGWLERILEDSEKNQDRGKIPVRNLIGRFNDMSKGLVEIAPNDIYRKDFNGDYPSPARKEKSYLDLIKPSSNRVKNAVDRIEIIENGH